MIEVRELNFGYNGDSLLRTLNFTVRKGEILTILGPNGCGKSTLLKLLRGQLKTTGGSVKWEGKDIAGFSALEKARRVAVVTQFTRVDFPYKVRDFVAMGRYSQRKHLFDFNGTGQRQAVDQALAMTDLLPLAERPVTVLSGGELQRAALARALAQETPVLFLDEATSHLDINHRLELSDLLLRQNRERQTTIIQVSHDFDLSAAMSDRILLLNEQGEIAALGTPAEVMTGPILSKVFRAEIKVEQNLLTGTPHIVPCFNTTAFRFDGLRIHLLCGGGSGRTILRRLHLGGADLSCGPVNLGDSDQLTATTLNLPTIDEQPFQPLSTAKLQQTGQLLESVRVLIVATQWWGPGNLACLELAARALDNGQLVYLLKQDPQHDFAGGQAWAAIERLVKQGAQQFDDEEQLLEQLTTLDL